MYAEFTENLATGNEMIDSQHKELIQKINDLLDSCEKSSDKVVAIKTLDFLSDYTEYISTQKNNFRRILSIPATTSTKPSMKNLRRP